MGIQVQYCHKLHQEANKAEVDKTACLSPVKRVPATNKTKQVSDTNSKQEPDTVTEVQSNAAVQTRTQVAKEKVSRPVRPMKVTKVEGLNITATEFRNLQESDSKLSKYWGWAKDSLEKHDPKAEFVIEDGMLYRLYKPGPNRDAIKQLMIPAVLEERVIAYAHEAMLSGHLGISSTINKLLGEFFILGYHLKVKRHIKSCDQCQRNGNNNKCRKAPNLSMPIVGEPFEKVYIDIVGEIHPASAEGHRWILTLVDNCTRFPVAIPMKRIDSISIAEELVGIWANWGCPKVCFSDNGSNLISAAMQEVHALMGITGQTAPCYHPQANSIVERSHSMMKNILRKLTIEQPNQWHRYITPLLFAMRTTPNSTGYSSFELMYGRTCYTHLSLLKTLWTGGEFQPEVKVNNFE